MTDESDDARNALEAYRTFAASLDYPDPRMSALAAVMCDLIEIIHEVRPDLADAKKRHYRRMFQALDARRLSPTAHGELFAIAFAKDLYEAALDRQAPQADASHPSPMKP